MEIIKIYPHYVQRKKIDKVLKVLRSGGVIAYPTDTIYGFGALIKAKGAVEKIYKIKGRDKKKPFSVLVDSIESMKRYAIMTENCEKVAKKLLPGKYTLILPKKSSVPAYVTSGKKSVGLRVVKDPISQAIARRLGEALISTSANISGRDVPASAEQIRKQFLNRKIQPDLIIDGGRRRGAGSTILQCDNKRIKLVRKGDGNLKSLKASNIYYER